MEDVRARLHGGPEDGRDVSLGADTSGRPIPRVSLPVRRRHGTPPSTAPVPRLIYERHDKLPDGVWRFRYIGVEFG